MAAAENDSLMMKTAHGTPLPTCAEVTGNALLSKISIPGKNVKLRQENEKKSQGQLTDVGFAEIFVLNTIE